MVVHKKATTKAKPKYTLDWNYLLLLLEILGGLNPEEVGQGAGHHPRSKVGSSSEASRRVSHEGPRIP